MLQCAREGPGTLGSKERGEDRSGGLYLTVGDTDRREESRGSNGSSPREESVVGEP